MWLLFVFLFVVAYLIYKYATNNHDYWKNLGVPFDKPAWFFGSLKEGVFLKKHFGEIMAEIYKKHDNVPYVGMFKFSEPVLLVRDPDLVKDILIKDFSHFQANDVEVSDKDVAINKHPFVLSGEAWKVARTQLLQCFTSAKMKSLVPPMEIVSSRFLNYIEEQTTESGALECKDISTRYTVENVVNTAFGIEGNCFQPGTSNFMEMSYKIFYPSLMSSLRIMCVIFFPTMSKYLDIRFIPKEVSEYFIGLITKLVKYRKENNIERKDFLNILMEMENKAGGDYGLDEIISHSMGLFMDGTETSANSMAFVLYEIASNLDVQKKLRDEIDAVKKKYDGKLTYEGIQEMTYMDCVFNESMRMHPPGLALAKKCTTDYELPLPNKDGSNNTFTLKAGTPVSIPLYAMQYDEKYYSHPERFDPERFSEENKPSIMKGTYLPFGEGQRLCLGQRFATLQIKIGLAAVLSNYELRVNEKTIRPLQIDPKFFMLLAKGGLWLDFHKRKDINL